MKNNFLLILHSQIAADAGPDEQDTLVQVAAIQKSLTALNLQVITLPFSLDIAELKKTLQQHQIKLVFNLVESIDGNGQLIHIVPAILEHLKVNYTGGDARSLFITSDKLLTKNILQAKNIPTPEWIEDEGDDLKPGLLRRFAPRNDESIYLVKSVTEDGSLGIDKTSIVNNPQQFKNIIADRKKQFGGRWFAERYIPGREFNISVIQTAQGVQVLPIAEIQFIDFAKDEPQIVGYAAKWLAGSEADRKTQRRFEFPETDQPLLNQLKALALTCWQTLDLKAYVRIDIRVDAQGQPWVLEVNVNPCLTPDAGFAAAAEQAGIGYSELLRYISEYAQNNFPSDQLD